MKKTITMLIGLTVMCSASAQSSNAIENFTTNAVLQSTCILSTENMNFGELHFLDNTTKSVTGNIFATCSKGITYTIVPTGGYGTAPIANSRHLLRSSDPTNKDCLVVGLALPLKNIWSSYYVSSIAGTGTGESVTHGIRTLLFPLNNVTGYDSSCTNNTNADAKPGNYAVNIVAQIIY